VLAAQSQLHLDDGARPRITSYFDQIRVGAGWVNGRSARSLFEDMLLRQARRISGELELAELIGDPWTEQERATRTQVLTEEDVPDPPPPPVPFADQEIVDGD
jgi:hypothetical protein